MNSAVHFTFIDPVKARFPAYQYIKENVFFKPRRATDQYKNKISSIFWIQVKSSFIYLIEIFILLNLLQNFGKITKK